MNFYLYRIGDHTACPGGKKTLKTPAGLLFRAGGFAHVLRLFQIIADQQGGEGRFLCKAEGFTQVAIAQAGRADGNDIFDFEMLLAFIQLRKRQGRDEEKRRGNLTVSALRKKDKGVAERHNPLSILLV